MRRYLLLVAMLGGDGPAVASAEPIALRAEWVRSGAARARVVADRADLVIFYGGEQRGRLGTCGCGAHPRGSLGRVEGYVRRSRRANPGVPTLLVNPGGFLARDRGEGTALRADAAVANRWMIEGLALGGWDALHLAFPDVPWLAAEPPPPGAVSASYTGEGAAPPWLLVPAGGLQVGITGVSGDGASYLRDEHLIHRDPLAALDVVVPEMRAAGADLVVVLGYALGRAAGEVAARGDLDVLVDADAHRGRFEPELRGRTVWVRAREETLALGELRLELEDGRIVGARDRLVDLDDRVPTPAPFRRLERRAESELAAVRAELFP